LLTEFYVTGGAFGGKECRMNIVSIPAAMAAYK